MGASILKQEYMQHQQVAATIFLFWYEFNLKVWEVNLQSSIKYAEKSMNLQPLSIVSDSSRFLFDETISLYKRHKAISRIENR